MKSSALSLLALLPILLAACGPADRPILTAHHVSLERMSGQWYEICHMQNYFQLYPEQTSAEYSVDARGNLDMVYSQRYQDKTRIIHADGEPVAGTGNARLIWRTHGIPMVWGHSENGTFCILDVGPGYRYAMIGTPDRKKLWIISRTPHLAKQTSSYLLGKAGTLGFMTQNVIWDSE
jgi:apolipoprotein D and lipocalin family protein